jgi:hypothetical protein
LPGADCNFVSLYTAGTSNGVFGVNIKAIGPVLQVNDGANVNGTTILSPNTSYRVAVSYTVTSSTVYTVNLYLNGKLEITRSNARTLSFIGTADLMLWGHSSFGASAFVYFDDIYVDDGTDLADPGNILVTHKRPFANGALNEFTTQVGSGGSGYGSGHAPQVNEQPSSQANAWTITSATKKTEEYTIESASVGDLDISAAKYSIVDYVGWIQAKNVSSNIGNILVNGVASNVSLTNAPNNFFKAAGSTTYPSGNAAIGMDNNTINTAYTLYECGIMLAVISNVAATSTEAPTTAESARGFAGFKANEAPTTAESLIKLRDVPRPLVELIKADAEFTPDLLLGLQLWLAADSLVLNDGDPVATWLGSGGTAANATQGNGANQPIFKTNILNGLPVVRFDGVASMMPFSGGNINACLNNVPGATAILVVVDTNPAGGTATHSIFAFSAGASPTNSRLALGSKTAYRANATRLDADAGSSTVGVSPTGFHVFTVLADYAGNSLRLVTDGVLGTAVTFVSGGGNTSATNTTFSRLGSRSDGNATAMFPGDLAEILLFNRALTTFERNQVEGYLAYKYGLTVSGGIQPLPVRTIAMPRPASDALFTAESVDHFALEPHSATDAPHTAELAGRIGILSRTTTD